MQREHRWAERETEKERERQVLLAWFKWLIWGSSSGFSLASPSSVWLRGLFCVLAHVSGKLTDHMVYLAPPPPRSLLCMCNLGGGVSLTSRMRTMWSLYPKQDCNPCSCHTSYLEVSFPRGHIPVAQPGVHLAPSSLACASWPFTSPFWRHDSSSLLPISQLSCFLCILRILYVLWNQVLCWIYNMKIFSSSSWLVSFMLQCLFAEQRFKLLMQSSLSASPLDWLCFCCPV